MKKGFTFFPRNIKTSAYRLFLVLQLNLFHLNRDKLQYQMPTMDTVALFLEEKNTLFGQSF